MKFRYLIFALFLSLTIALPVRAADVSLCVEVVQKTPTDTINDFDFSSVDQNYFSIENPLFLIRELNSNLNNLSQIAMPAKILGA